MPWPLPHPALSLGGARWAGPRQPGQILSLALFLPSPWGARRRAWQGGRWWVGRRGCPATVGTDGRLGRGPELAHLLLPLQGLFSAPPTELGWVHSKSLWMLCRPWLSAGVPAQFPLGVAQPLLAAQLGLDSQCWKRPWGSPD